MLQRIIVSWIIQKDDKILIWKKAKWQPPYPDVWHTLGWWIDNLQKWLVLLESQDYNNEYFHKELQRELREEADIEISSIYNICPQYRKSPREWITKNKHWVETHYIFLEYLCNYHSWEEKPWDDIAKLQWVDKKDIWSISLTPPSIEMYRELGYI